MNYEEISDGIINGKYAIKAKYPVRNDYKDFDFEKNFEEQIFSLFEDIKTSSYKPKSSITFIVNKPVKREIFENPQVSFNKSLKEL